MTDRRDIDPKPLGDLLKTLVAGRGWHDHMALGRLREAWAEAVGENIAAHSQPIALARGVLTVRAEGGTWATELTLMAGPLATTIDTWLAGQARVNEVRISGGSGRPSGPGGSRSFGSR